MLAAVVVTMLGASGVFGEQSSWARAVEFVVGLLAAMGYSFNRTSVKKDPPK
jgi:type IV secretory pathway VirB2 component (pilin)